MTSKDTQLNVKLPPRMSRWLEERAGGRNRRADYVRELIESDMRRARLEEETLMFNRAAADLTPDDLDEREDLLTAFSNQVD